MRKSEVKSLLSLIGGVDRVVLLLLLGHGVPPPVANLVAPDVERFDEVKQNNVEAADPEQNLISTAIQRLVIISIDV